jgi:hypothetical protein
MSAAAVPQSPQEALALALWLALTAPSPEREALAVELAEQLSAGLTAGDVRAAKRAALQRWRGQS